MTINVFTKLISHTCMHIFIAM